MDIRCPSCSKLFRVADEKIAGKGIRFKCSKCSEVITITKDDFEMDLLAREGEAASPSAPPSAPSPKPAAAPAPPTPVAEPEAREYKPPVEPSSDEEPAADQQLPAASLGEFDFSEPHAAATAAAHPAEGFGGDFAFGAEHEQEQTAPEIEISPEAAAEAEASLDFPVDLISEPKRKPAFGGPAASEPPAPEPAQELGVGPEAAEEELDLGAALAMPKEPAAAFESAAAGHEADPGPAPATQAGPMFTPELLAQMRKSSTAKPAAQAKAPASEDEDMDLGAALAMPKSSGKVDTRGSGSLSLDASAAKGGDGGSSGNRVLIIAVIAVVLVAVLGALYYLGFLWGKGGPEVQQKSQQRPAQAITPAGLQVVNAHAYFDPATGDLVITGSVRNTLDAPKAGWYLVTEVRDAKETVLATARMVNGAQLYSNREYEVLAKRGAKVDDLKKKAAAASGKGAIAAKGSIDFEVRVVDPPAGSAGFLPTLRSFDPATLGAPQ